MGAIMGNTRLVCDVQNKHERTETTLQYIHSNGVSSLKNCIAQSIIRGHWRDPRKEDIKLKITENLTH